MGFLWVYTIAFHPPPPQLLPTLMLKNLKQFGKIFTLKLLPFSHSLHNSMLKIETSLTQERKKKLYIQAQNEN